MSDTPKKPFDDDDLARTFESVLWQLWRRDAKRCKVIIDRMKAQVRDDENGHRKKAVDKPQQVV